MDETYINVKGVWKYLYRAVVQMNTTACAHAPTAHRCRRRSG
jgi:transposase-like protein